MRGQRRNTRHIKKLISLILCLFFIVCVIPLVVSERSNTSEEIETEEEVKKMDTFTEKMNVGECTTPSLSDYYIMSLEGNSIASRQDIDNDGELEIKGDTWENDYWIGSIYLTYYAYSNGSSTITGQSSIQLNYSIAAMIRIRPDDGKPRKITNIEVIDLNDSNNVIWRDAASGLNSRSWYWKADVSGGINLQTDHHYRIRLHIRDAWSGNHVRGVYEYIEISYGHPIIEGGTIPQSQLFIMSSEMWYLLGGVTVIAGITIMAIMVAKLDLLSNLLVKLFERSRRRDVQEEEEREEVTGVGTNENISRMFLYYLSVVFVIILIFGIINWSVGNYRLNLLIIPMAALIGFLVLVLIGFQATPSHILPTSRTRQSVRSPKRAVTEIALKEIQCAFCGEKLRITEDMQYCRFCGEIIPQCRICGSPIVHGDEILQCPYCKAYAHKTHLIEWIKIKGYCPVCGVDVEESKDFPSELFDQRITSISKKKEMISPLDEKNQCSSCERVITKNVHFCPYCGVKIPQCVVCCLPIMKGEEFVNCPHCGSFAHKNHLIEWMKSKGVCPHCRKRLTRSDFQS